ncbi:hypothetical protein, partial [Salmonella enterica]|uniref:hypothetical protein n=1 Tax=Salmonella enterica TaxID=28901 RepID=UPI001C3842DD
QGNNIAKYVPYVYSCSGYLTRQPKSCQCSHKTQRVLNVRKDGPVGVSFANHPHVLQYAPVAVRWRYPV